MLLAERCPFVIVCVLRRSILKHECRELLILVLEHSGLIAAGQSRWQGEGGCKAQSQGERKGNPKAKGRTSALPFSLAKAFFFYFVVGEIGMPSWWVEFDWQLP